MLVLQHKNFVDCDETRLMHEQLTTLLLAFSNMVPVSSIHRASLFLDFFRSTVAS